MRSRIGHQSYRWQELELLEGRLLLSALGTTAASVSGHATTTTSQTGSLSGRSTGKGVTVTSPVITTSTKSTLADEMTEVSEDSDEDEVIASRASLASMAISNDEQAERRNRETEGALVLNLKSNEVTGLALVPTSILPASSHPLLTLSTNSGTAADHNLGSVVLGDSPFSVGIPRPGKPMSGPLPPISADVVVAIRKPISSFESQEPLQSDSQTVSSGWAIDGVGNRHRALNDAIDRVITRWDHMLNPHKSWRNREPIAFGVVSCLVASLSMAWLRSNLRQVLNDEEDERMGLVGRGSEPYGFPEFPDSWTLRKS